MGVEAAAARSSSQEDSRTLVARLAAGIAHELRNPLAVILARVQLLDLGMKGGKVPDADKLTRTIKTIEEQALRASRIIESLSAFARPRPPEAQTVHLQIIVNH